MVSFIITSILYNISLNPNFYLIIKGDPNIVGRDGSVPIMVLLIPLINTDTLQHYTHSMKVSFINV